MIVSEACDSEVENLRLAGSIDQDIGRLEIAMNQSAPVRVLHGVADPRDQFEPLARVERVRCGIVPERFTQDELHREMRLRTEAGIGGAGLVDLRDARMLQPAERLRLALEAAQELRVGQAWLDDFQRDDPARVILFRLVDRAHASFADQAQHPVTPDGRRQPSRRRGGGARRTGRDPRRLPHRRVEDAFALSRLQQQRFHFPLQLGIVRADPGEERGAIARRMFQDALTDVLHALPAFGSHGGYGAKLAPLAPRSLLFRLLGCGETRHRSLDALTFGTPPCPPGTAGGVSDGSQQPVVLRHELDADRPRYARALMSAEARARAIERGILGLYRWFSEQSQRRRNWHADTCVDWRAVRRDHNDAVATIIEGFFAVERYAGLRGPAPQSDSTVVRAIPVAPVLGSRGAAARRSVAQCRHGAGTPGPAVDRGVHERAETA